MPSASRPLPPNLERIVQRFQQITEPKQRYEHLLWFAKRVPELSEAEQVAATKVPGCVSCQSYPLPEQWILQHLQVHAAKGVNCADC